MSRPFKSGDSPGHFVVTRPVTDNEIVAMANQLARRRFARGRVLSSPSDASRFLVSRYAGLEYEMFAAVFLDNRHRVLAFEELFRGTMNGASVYPREVVRHALSVNAAAVLFAHNHPSGDPEPSDADVTITRRLKESLALIEVRLLDHVVIGFEGVVSMAERGQL